MKWPTLFLISLCLFVMPHMAFACSCVESPMAESVKMADVIFTGRAINIDYPSMHKSKTTFKILAVKKGIELRRKDITVNSAIDTFSCGMSFSEGKDYLVFASTRNGKLSVGSCTPTKLLEDAEDDLKEL